MKYCPFCGTTDIHTYPGDGHRSIRGARCLKCNRAWNNGFVRHISRVAQYVRTRDGTVVEMRDDLPLSKGEVLDGVIASVKAYGWEFELYFSGQVEVHRDEWGDDLPHSLGAFHVTLRKRTGPRHSKQVTSQQFDTEQEARVYMTELGAQAESGAFGTAWRRVG